MPVPAFIPGLISLVKQVLPRVLTDRDQELEVGREIELEVMRAASDSESTFYSFVLDYEGRAADASRVVQFIRSMVRPILTLGISACYLYGFLHPSKFSSDRMEQLSFALAIVLIFWFGDKAVRNAAPVIAQMFNKGK